MSETLNVFSRRALVAPTHFLILFPFPGADKCFPTRLPGTFVSSSFPSTSKFFYFLSLFSAMIIGVHPVGGFSTSTENVMNVVPVVDPENTGYGGKNSILFNFSSSSFLFSEINLYNDWNVKTNNYFKVSRENNIFNSF